MIIDELRRLAAGVPSVRPDPRKAWGPNDALSSICIYERARAEFWKAYATWLDRWLARLNYATFDAERKKILAERNSAHDIVHLVREKEKS